MNMGVSLLPDATASRLGLSSEISRIPTKMTWTRTTPKGVVQVFMKQLENGYCIALDPITRFCTIQDIKPYSCSSFPRADSLEGNEECLKALEVANGN